MRKPDFLPKKTRRGSMTSIDRIPLPNRDPMPWNALRYPPAMENLPVLVRAKAIEIANALLERGRDEGAAIRIAIAAAKRWAQRRGVE